MNTTPHHLRQHRRQRGDRARRALRPARPTLAGAAGRRLAAAVPCRRHARRRTPAAGSRRPGRTSWPRCAAPRARRPPPSSRRCSRASASPRSSPTRPSTSPAPSTTSRWPRCAPTWQRLGLARDEQMLETEDHIAYVFEVMRYLIAGDDVGRVQPGTAAALLPHPPADLGRGAVRDHLGPSACRHLARGGRFTPNFMHVETQGFDCSSLTAGPAATPGEPVPRPDHRPHPVRRPRHAHGRRRQGPAEPPRHAAGPARAVAPAAPGGRS